MSVERDERIKQRAYELWQEQGMPEGQENEHWEQASREIDARDDADLRNALDQSAGTSSGETLADNAALEENLSVLGEDSSAKAGASTGASKKRSRRNG